ATALLIAFPSLAHAEDAGTPTATAKAATGVENRLPVGEASKFKKGDRIFVWSEVLGADGQSVEHVWKRDGKEFRRARFDVQSRRWRVNSRMQDAHPGSYVVEVVAGDKVIGSVNFTVESQ